MISVVLTTHHISRVRPLEFLADLFHELSGSLFEFLEFFFLKARFS